MPLPVGHGDESVTKQLQMPSCQQGGTRWRPAREEVRRTIKLDCPCARAAAPLASLPPAAVVHDHVDGVSCLWATYLVLHRHSHVAQCLAYLLLGRRRSWLCALERVTTCLFQSSHVVDRLHTKPRIHAATFKELMDLAQMEGIEACTLAQGPQTLRDRIDRICFKRGIPGIEPGTLQITKRILGSEVTGTQILPNSTGPFVINATNRIFFKLFSYTPRGPWMAYPRIIPKNHFRTYKEKKVSRPSQKIAIRRSQSG